MTAAQMAETLGLEILVTGDASREAGKVYCCDLLSFVMGRAPADGVWVTVMGNVNAMAVALLADVACVVLAEGAALDEQAAQKANENDICVLRSALPVFDAALAIHQTVSAS